MQPHFRYLFLLCMCSMLLSTLGGCGKADTLAPTGTVPPPTRTPIIHPSPRATNTTNGQQEQEQTPICTFQGSAAAPQASVPAPESYVFSEPQIIMRQPIIGLNEWIPGTNKVLLSFGVDNLQKVAIGLFDTQTGSFEEYARIKSNTKPVWLADEQAIAYATIDQLPPLHISLHLSRGAGKADEVLATNLVAPYLAQLPKTHEIGLLTREDHGQPSLLAASRGKASLRALPGQRIRQRDDQAAAIYVYDAWTMVRMVASPDDSKVVLYSQDGTYLKTMADGALCRLNLGDERWALDVQWSPDGRYLAALTSTGTQIGNLPETHVMTIDTLTGASYSFDKQWRYTYEFTWLPNSQQLLFLSKTGTPTNSARRLFLTTIGEDSYRQILPTYSFGHSPYDRERGALLFSPDGNTLLITCPENTEDRLCLVNITTH